MADEHKVPDFDLDKIKDMEYDSSRGRFVGEDGSEFRTTPFKDGSGVKYDYYGSSTYDDKPHDAVHFKGSTDGSWTTDSHNEDKTEQEHDEGHCYLTTACMKHFKENFKDDCYELSVLRWFRDNYITEEDVQLYYAVAPIIVSAIDEDPESDKIYDYIFDSIVLDSVEAIEEGNYLFAYERYKNSVIALYNQFVNSTLGKKSKQHTFEKQK